MEVYLDEVNSLNTIYIPRKLTRSGNQPNIIVICYFRSKRRQIFPADWALQSISHPPLQTLTMENVSTRRYHVGPPTEDGRGCDRGNRLSIAVTSRGYNRHLNVFCTDSAVEYLLAFLLAFSRLGSRWRRRVSCGLCEADRHY